MERDLDGRLLDFAVEVVKLLEALPKAAPCRRISDQLLRRGISVGAHYQEAQAAESREDFVHKIQVALKELRESHYWLQLLTRLGGCPSERLARVTDEAAQLRSILSKAVATAKGKGVRE